MKFFKNSGNAQLSRINHHHQSVRAETGRKARHYPWTTYSPNARALAVVLALATVVTFVPSANAQACKNVDIFLDNQTDVRVKALYAYFKCEGENERKEMFNNEEVPETTKLLVARQQDLQGCKDKKMEYFKVVYRVRCLQGGWSPEKSIKDSTFKNAFCSSDAGKQYTVVLPANDPQASCD